MMKKTVSGLIIAAALAFVFAGCDTPTSSGSGDPAGNTVVTGVTLDRTSLTVAVGATATLQATVSPASATDKAVTWVSSDTAVATVAAGVVTGVAPGTATITVSTVDGGKTATCTVTVKSLSSIEITAQPAQKDYFIGDTIDLAGLVVTAKWSDGSEESITDYTPSKSVFEEADAGTGIGTVTITISYGSVTPVTFDVTVRYKIIGVTVSPATATVVKGQSKPFEATVTVDQGIAPPAAVTAVTWSIEEAGKNEETTISNAGLLTVAAGETLDELTVKAVSTYDNTQSDTATVTLISKPNSITVEVPSNYSVFIGEELDLTQITVTAVYNDGTPNKPISGITKDNLSKSVFAETDHGSQSVTVTYADDLTATFNVTVKYKITGVTVSPSTKDFTKGEGGTQSFTATVTVDKGTTLPNEVKAVTWSIEEAKTGSTTETEKGTTINESGTLSVAAGETLNGLTVKAVSTYDAANQSQSGTATVTITRRVASIAVTTKPTKKDYYIGDAIDLTGLVVTATYSDSTEDTVANTNVTITNFDTTAAGENKNVTVTYEGKSATFSINVHYKVEGITVSPATADVNQGQQQPFTVAVTAESGTPDATVGTVAWSIVTEKANGTTIDASTGALSVAADETAPSLTVKAVFTYDGGKTWENTATINVGQLINASNWASTLAAISGATGGTGGAPKVWTLVMQSNFDVAGASVANVTGNYKEVRLKGAKTISLSGTGSIIRTNTGAKVIIDGPTLKGYSPAESYYYNNAPVVYVEGGSVELKSGKITGNKNNTNLAVGLGGGVYVASGAAFAMTGGEISGNLDNSQLDGFTGDYARNGGGVCVDGTFTMSGGTIKDNKGHKVGGVWVDGEFTMSGAAEVSGNINGGILVGKDGKFTMSGGKVSGHKNLTNEEYPDESSGGTGVIVRGTFTMNGTAEISGNEDSGVNVAAWSSDNNTALLYRGDFTMSGGTISGNSSPSKGGNMGGGVSVMGSFKMQGGTIKGNTGASGGGVFVMSPPIQAAEFTMTNGTIHGSNSADPNTATGQANMIEQSKAGAAVFYMFYAIGPDKMIFTYFYRDTALTDSHPMPASANDSAPNGWGKGTMEIDVPKDNN